MINNSITDEEFYLTTSGNYKAINQVNKKAPAEVRLNITIMVTFAKTFVNDLNSHAYMKRNAKVRIYQANKLICIVSRDGIDWQPNTDKIQAMYNPNLNVVRKINHSTIPIVIDDEELENALMLKFPF